MARPLKFKSPEEMQKKIDAYFAECDKKGKPYTITGLALALDTTRELLLRYEEDETRPGFRDTVKKAKQRCQAYAEEQLFAGKGNVAGVIFNMKNNYGWRDQHAMELTGKDGGPLVVQLEGKLDEWSK